LVVLVKLSVLVKSLTRKTSLKMPFRDDEINLASLPKQNVVIAGVRFLHYMLAKLHRSVL